MLELLGTIAGNILSLPGILGLGLGMLTRSPILGMILGGLVGVLESYAFARWDFARIDPTELVVAIIVGIVFGLLGSLIRRRGALV